MKLTKLSKALAIFSATAMLFTSFVSCSDSSDDEGKNGGEEKKSFCIERRWFN